MKFRIVERHGENFETHYVVQRRIVPFLWVDMWRDYLINGRYGGFTWGLRTFKTVHEARNAIDRHLYEMERDRVVETIDVRPKGSSTEKTNETE